MIKKVNPSFNENSAVLNFTIFLERSLLAGQDQRLKTMRKSLLPG